MCICTWLNSQRKALRDQRDPGAGELLRDAWLAWGINQQPATAVCVAGGSRQQNQQQLHNDHRSENESRLYTPPCCLGLSLSADINTFTAQAHQTWCFFYSITWSGCEPGSTAGWGWRLVWDQWAAGRAAGTSETPESTLIEEQPSPRGCRTAGWWRRPDTGCRSSTVQSPGIERKDVCVMYTTHILHMKDSSAKTHMSIFIYLPKSWLFISN